MEKIPNEIHDKIQKYVTNTTLFHTNKLWIIHYVFVNNYNGWSDHNIATKIETFFGTKKELGDYLKSNIRGYLHYFYLILTRNSKIPIYPYMSSKMDLSNKSYQTYIQYWFDSHPHKGISEPESEPEPELMTLLLECDSEDLVDSVLYQPNNYGNKFFSINDNKGERKDEVYLTIQEVSLNNIESNSSISSLSDGY